MTSKKNYNPIALYSHAGNPTNAAGDVWYDSTLGVVKANLDGTAANMVAPPEYPWIITTSYYYMPGWVFNVATTLTAMTLSTTYYYPVSVGHKCTLSSFNLWCTTGGGSSNVLRAGIFAGETGKPGTLIADWGTKVSTTTGRKEWTPSQAIDPGIPYWVGVNSQVGTACTVVTGKYHNPKWFPQDSAGAPTNQNAFEQTTLFGIYRQTGVTGAFANAGTLLRDGQAPVAITQFT